MDPDSTSIETPDSDPLDAERTRIFFQWLHAREEDGYEGNLDGVFGWWALLPTHVSSGVLNWKRIACSRISSAHTFLCRVYRGFGSGL